MRRNRMFWFFAYRLWSLHINKQSEIMAFISKCSHSKEACTWILYNWNIWDKQLFQLARICQKDNEQACQRWNNATCIRMGFTQCIRSHNKPPSSSVRSLPTQGFIVSKLKYLEKGFPLISNAQHTSTRTKSKFSWTTSLAPLSGIKRIIRDLSVSCFDQRQSRS